MEGLDGILFQEGFLSFNSDALPSDPMFAEQWNLHMIGVHNAWRFTQGSANVVVGVQDTGLGITSAGQIHADINGQRTYGVASNVDDDFTSGSISHGTAVHGIIAAQGNDGIGMSGINWHSDAISIDVFGPDAYTLDQATQMMADYAASTGQRLVINMSLGAHGAGAGAMPMLEQLIAQNIDNALFVVSSGNADDGFTSYPSILSRSYENVMAIGASWGSQDWDGNATNPGERISYPDWWGSNYGYGLSVMGPSEVISTMAVAGSSGVGFGYHQNAPAGGSRLPFNGTSAAAPNVAGVASLVWSANPYLSAGQVHQILQTTAVDLGFPGYDYEYGAGFVNADAAVRRAMAMAGGAVLTSNVMPSNALELSRFVALDAMASTGTNALEQVSGMAGAGQEFAMANSTPLSPLALTNQPEPGEGSNAPVADYALDPEFIDFGKVQQHDPDVIADSSLDIATGDAELTLAKTKVQPAELRFTQTVTSGEDDLAQLQYDSPWEADWLTGSLQVA
jgi:hypothetical protein